MISTIAVVCLDSILQDLFRIEVHITGTLSIDMDVMVIMTIGMMTHSSGAMVGAMDGLGALGAAGMVRCGDGDILIIGTTGVGATAGAVLIIQEEVPVGVA